MDIKIYFYVQSFLSDAICLRARAIDGIRESKTIQIAQCAIRLVSFISIWYETMNQHSVDKKQLHARFKMFKGQRNGERGVVFFWHLNDKKNFNIVQWRLSISYAMEQYKSGKSLEDIFICGQTIHKGHLMLKAKVRLVRFLCECVCVFYEWRKIMILGGKSLEMIQTGNRKLLMCVLLYCLAPSNNHAIGSPTRNSATAISGYQLRYVWSNTTLHTGKAEHGCYFVIAVISTLLFIFSSLRFFFFAAISPCRWHPKSQRFDVIASR